MRVSSMSMTALAVASQAVVASALSQEERAAAVKQTFQIAWDGYYNHAFPHDELHPEDNGNDDNFGGWGASAVDALSTAIVMGNKEVVSQILNYIPKIDFTRTNETSISLFETTIRYLGGLVSGYDLLTGPAADLVDDKELVDTILAQATSLADTLSYAFDTPSGVPYNNLLLNTRSNDGSTSNGLATTGSLILEWTRLSDLTGNKTYGQLAQKAESHLLNPQPSWTQPFPGLVGSYIDIASGNFTDDYVSWNGGDDSYYEYLIKFWVYDSQYTQYRDSWLEAASSTITHLTAHPDPRPDLTFVNIWNNGTLISTSEHLTGFIGGNFLLAGSTLQRQDLIDYGLALTASWHETYNSTATKIGPEVFAWDKAGVPADQKAFYDKYGFYITAADYVLRPEVIESYYYAYRITGDQKYREWAWDAYLAINSTCHTGSGYAGLNNVNIAGGGGFDNEQESFLFAEVLKYSYLIQAEDADWQVQADGSNKFVFNTEAHPIRVKA
ncbi:mannosidase MsdS [Talaromyces proteolyticus]|uniref:alpha-1,2-Mannosidase n=1 Tax=Talaromyces proteolyticus TaxID=1131652 RepID=A0AAD4KRF7_9EURO|nr:mannosidase MsdS [Talaromyces proteolyticus]KAH8698780.1 mannosidase MsdS [Talaromyces proteolyticus]